MRVPNTMSCLHTLNRRMHSIMSRSSFLRKDKIDTTFNLTFKNFFNIKKVILITCYFYNLSIKSSNLSLIIVGLSKGSQNRFSKKCSQTLMMYLYNHSSYYVFSLGLTDSALQASKVCYPNPQGTLQS